MADVAIVQVQTYTPAGVPFEEPLLAMRIGPRVAKLMTIPVFEVTLSVGDLVHLDGDDYITGVAEHSGARTRRCIFDAAPDEDAVRRQLRCFRSHFGEWEVTVGPNPDWPAIWPATMGALLLAPPADMTDEELEEVCRLCPMPLTIIQEYGVAESP